MVHPAHRANKRDSAAAGREAGREDCRIARDMRY
jgi:hypothetical protein